MDTKKLKIFLTVDVEPRLSRSVSHYPHVLPQGIEALYGVEFLCNTLKHYDIDALFFVEALHHHYFKNSLFDYLAPFLKYKNIEIGLHIHPAWTFFSTSKKVSDHCKDLSKPQLVSMINDGLTKLAEFAKKPIDYFRSGNLSSSDTLYQALSQFHFKAVSTSARAYGSGTYHYHGPFEDSGVIDIPVTCFKRTGFRDQILSITGVSFAEMKTLMWQAHQKNLDFLTIITHPFEFIDHNKKNIFGNQTRLTRLCQFVQENSGYFEFSTDLSSIKPTKDTILVSNPLNYITSLVEAKINEYY